ncbi:ribosome small subunit-dependent GTPase A [Spirochaeta africana]|uniref:Small ribosomal subunit biogenesis GTPase RsgA n=1 Tax=Spirochaeta africana (strain ATCC 700263 / DSM 8902 / Z-7692) TaxID=889378 RepID=H9UJL6_SPIAZ|nr:ribosome small subunit-dependent GTPase A [Spirochaeta africana]AFG37709.1 ribosome small subunit-dependent GTPase A [Spirochaeta africana DSM 8902]
MTGLVLQGINNIFTVMHENQTRLCRLKGKVLDGAENSYNPLAPGDLVEFEGELILRRHPRRNCLFRWNRKRNNMQAVAANVDQVVLFGSVGEPPFRPRFIDRALVLAELAGIPAVVVINKSDLTATAAEQERIDVYRQVGYRVHRISALTGDGLEDLRHILADKRSVLYGQSGVGKSSCINAMYPDCKLKTGEVSRKHNRGRHTTNYGRLLTAAELGSQGSATAIIDTPGIRELHIMGYTEYEIASGYREIAALAPGCSYNGCTHIHEPDCAVRAAVDRGELHPDRFASYAKTRADMQDLTKQYGVPRFDA